MLEALLGFLPTSTSSGDKRVTNTPEITPGDGEITPDENLELLIGDINILSVGEMSTTRMTREKGIGTPGPLALG